MVGSFGEVQVMDWGLAKIVPESAGNEAEAMGNGGSTTLEGEKADNRIPPTRSAQQTQTGSVLGTPAYMAPEQAQGRISQLDERCDVFGLGAILCEILTGQPPYGGSEGTDVRFLATTATLTGTYQRLDACGADPELIHLARRCLAAEPTDRPRDARSLGKELTAYLESVEARLRQAELDSARARAKAEEERKRRRLTLALAVSVLLTVVLGAGAWLWIVDEKATRQRQVAEEKAKRQREAAAERAKRDLEVVTQKARRSRQVQEALDRAVRLHDQARVAAAGETGKWGEARSMARRAEALLEGGPVELELAGRVRTLNA